MDCLRNRLYHVKLNQGFSGVDNVEILFNLTYSLVREYGLSVAFLVLYPVTLIYVLALRHKENQKTLQVINDLIKSNNLLSGEVHQAMQNANSIIAASIYALNGNKYGAVTILSDVVKVNQSQEDE